MPDDGAVDRQTVLKVLQLHGVDVAYDDKGNGVYVVQIARPKNPTSLRVVPLGEHVHRRMTQNLSRWYGIAIHYFYNPQLIPEMGSVGASSTIADNQSAYLASATWQESHAATAPVEVDDQTGPATGQKKK